MDRVAYTVLLLYVVMCALLFFPFIYIAWYPDVNFSTLFSRDIISPDFIPGYVGYLLIIVICQSALLYVPVAIKSHRTVTRKSILPAIFVGSLLLGILVFGIFISIAIIFQNLKGSVYAIATIAAFFVSWLAWGIYFWILSATSSPEALINKLASYLLKGSILEFLIAVPAHIIARQRTDCCAGVGNFIGLTFGFSVMLISFGPGIYYLFKKRLSRLRREE